MTAKVIRFSDYERRGRDADAVSARDPADSAVIILLPAARPPEEEKRKSR